MKNILFMLLLLVLGADAQTITDQAVLYNTRGRFSLPVSQEVIEKITGFEVYQVLHWELTSSDYFNKCLDFVGQTCDGEYFILSLECLDREDLALTLRAEWCLVRELEKCYFTDDGCASGGQYFITNVLTKN